MKMDTMNDHGSLKTDAMNDHGNMIRWVVTLSLGMLVTLWRVVLPTTGIETTKGIVILVAVLDLTLTTALILINKTQLKEAFTRKFTIKDFFKTILFFVIFIFLSLLSMWIIQMTGLYYPAPADLVAINFDKVFPLGLIISMTIAAPIWEEIAFRMAGRNLIKNKFLYVLITSLLFGFIHTGSFLTPSILSFFISGVILSSIYLKTKDIRIVMAVHFMGNTLGRIMAFINQ